MNSKKIGSRNLWQLAVQKHVGGKWIDCFTQKDQLE